MTLATHDIILGKLSERSDDPEPHKEYEPSPRDHSPRFPPPIRWGVQCRPRSRLTDPRDMPGQDLERFSIRDRLDRSGLI